jgi:uncharacterized protein (DUF1697 family)
MTRMVALLRGVNVGGNRRLPMAELRGLAASLGWTGVETYIQSGNLIFEAESKPAELEQALERALAAHLGAPVEAIVRTATAWRRYLSGVPFADAVRARPRFLHLLLAKARARTGAVAALRERACAGERVELVGEALWIDFAGGVGKSKLAPAVLDRAVGSTVTARNWQTVIALAELLDR